MCPIMESVCSTGRSSGPACVQASAVGAASFGSRSRGRAGAATFGRLPDGWEALVAGSDVLAAAAEVVLGRRDLLDLTASGMPDELAHEVRTHSSPHLCINFRIFRAAAAEVVLGRRDSLDLTASRMPDDLAHEVRTP